MVNIMIARALLLQALSLMDKNGVYITDIHRQVGEALIAQAKSLL